MQDLNTILVKQHFYSKRRQKLMVNKLYLRTTLKNQEIEITTNLVESSGNHTTKYVDDVIPKHSALENNFQHLDSNEKWILSTGKCVDNELFIFGSQCDNNNHPSKSLIIDPDDENYLKYLIFTPEELNEIRNFRKKNLPTLPQELKQHINNYNLNDIKQLRKALGQYHLFKEDYDNEDKFDIDWVNYVVYSLVREYENGNLDRGHKEAWYLNHVWFMIATSFDKLKNIEAVIGESSSFATKKRKNQARSINALDQMDAMKHGHKCDLIFRTYQKSHEVPYEFGATEAGSKNEDVYGTKTMVEGYIKLPRILKDMLDDLLSRVNYDDRSSQLRTVGFINSGLSSVFLQLDRPSKYVSRVTRSKQINISSDPSLFGTTVLPAIVSAWSCREIVTDVLNIVNSPDITSDSSWLDSCLDVAPPQPIPQTSSSSSTNFVKLKNK